MIINIEFITQPHSINISEGEIGNFSCTSTSSFGLSWLVNGVGLHEHTHRSIVKHPNKILPGGAQWSILSVPGLSINDNINVKCVLTPFIGESLFSGLAILRIQGKDHFPIVYTITAWYIPVQES